MKFPERIRAIGTETSFEVLAQVTKLRNKGIDVVSFCIGEPDFDTPPNIKEAGKKAIDDGWTHYCPSPGLDLMKDAAVRFLKRTRNVDVDPERIIICPGGKPVIFFTMLAIIEEGDEVIYPNPGYPIYESMAEFSGAKAVPLPILESKQFTFDINDLKARITDKTKLLVINSPMNPTGGVMTEEDNRAVKELSDRHGFMVLTDEIYSQIVYDGTFASYFSIGDPERTILLEGHSKAYAMTGWRLGFGVFPKEMAYWVARLMTNSNSCTASFTQVAGAEALDGTQQYVDEMVATFKKRRDMIVNGLNSIDGIRCMLPKGTFYVFPNVTGACRKRGFRDADQLQRYLLYVGHVAALPKTSFGRRLKEETDEYLRFSYATSSDDIKEGLRRMDACLKDEEAIKRFIAEDSKT